MKKESTEKMNLNELRKRSEKLQPKKTASIQNAVHDDYQELIHELQTHQIELEVQNEDLRKTQMELEESRQKYIDLFDLAPVGYFMFDKNGFILNVNLTAARLLNFERRNLINREFSRFIDPEYQDRFYLHRRAVFRDGKKQTCDLKLLNQDDLQLYARLESTAVQSKTGNNRQIRTTVTDISGQVQASEALRESERKYKLLFNEMISGLAVYEIKCDKRGKPFDFRRLDVNSAYERITGLKKDQIIGKTIREVLPKTEEYWFERLSEVALTGNPIQYENYHQQLDKHFMVSAFRLQEGQVAVSFTDITDRMGYEKKLKKSHDELEKRVVERTSEIAKTNTYLKQEIAERRRAEEALTAERQRLYSVLDVLPAFVYLESADHSIRFANRYFREQFGDFEGKKCYELLKGINEPCKECPSSKVIETGKAQVWEDLELRDGRLYQIYDYPFTDVDGTQLVLELGIDITKRRQAESELQRLSSRLLNAQEDERRRIAFELHDELGQDLTVLKLHIDSIKRKLHQDQSTLHKAFEDVLLEVNKTIDKVRRISRDLSPSVLVDLGLTAALRWMINSFAKHANIEISADIMDTKDLFSTEQQIAIYRIFQEIFTNISKYARATQVSIKIRKKNNKVFFSLKDNGIGFDIEQIKVMYAPEKGLGLAAMEWRTKMLNGRIEIFSQEGEGTRIAFEIPVDNSRRRKTMK